MAKHQTISRLSALAGHYETGTFGAGGDGRPGLKIQELRPTGIAQINGAPSGEAMTVMLSGFALSDPPSARRSCAGNDLTLMWSGADQWMAVSHKLSEQALLAALEHALTDSDATVTDLSHARTVFSFTGANAADLLCKGCPADIEAMIAGDCMSTVLGVLSVQILCKTALVDYEVYVFRSFGLDLWEWVEESAAEFGYQVV